MRPGEGAEACLLVQFLPGLGSPGVRPEVKPSASDLASSTRGCDLAELCDLSKLQFLLLGNEDDGCGRPAVTSVRVN